MCRIFIKWIYGEIFIWNGGDDGRLLDENIMRIDLTWCAVAF